MGGAEGAGLLPAWVGAGTRAGSGAPTRSREEPKFGRNLSCVGDAGLSSVDSEF